MTKANLSGTSRGGVLQGSNAGNRSDDADPVRLELCVP